MISQYIPLPYTEEQLINWKAVSLQLKKNPEDLYTWSKGSEIPGEKNK